MDGLEGGKNDNVEHTYAIDYRFAWAHSLDRLNNLNMIKEI